MTNQKKLKNSYPSISIVMPSYNTEAYIGRSIESVVSQDYPNLELFIKDGGSSDTTVKVIKSYAKRYPKIISWISSKDEGQTEAINYGINQTKGEIVAYLNSDDVYKPGAFKKVAKAFHKTNVKWLVGRSDIINKDDKVIRPLITTYKNFWLNFYSYKTLLVINYIPQMSVFWKREVMKEIGYFDPKQFYVMDYEYWLRLGKNYTPLILKDCLSSFRVINTSKSTTGFIKQFSDEYKAAQKHTKNKFLLNLHAIHIRMITYIYNLINL